MELTKIVEKCEERLKEAYMAYGDCYVTSVLKELLLDLKSTEEYRKACGIILDNTQKPVVVKQFIANWYEKNKHDLEFSIFDYLYRFEEQEDTSFKEWFNYAKGEPLKTLVSMHLFGYKVEEKLYLVKMKGIKAGEAYLNYNSKDKVWYFDNRINGTSVKTFHTKEELEKSGFGWVFNSPGVEVTEVEEG